jgi:branched-chain amino acid aminotransferase
LNYINLNGKITDATHAALPVDNGAFRYGYGLFETMLVQDGMIRLKEFHWERLFAGLEQLYFEIPPLMTAAWLEAEVLRTVAKNQSEKLCRVRLQMYAGGGGIFSSESRQPGFIIECFPPEAGTLKLNENGLVAGIAAGLAKSIDMLSNLKSCSALIYAIAARQARENKWNDALVCNTNGHIIESAIANIFWIKDGIVYSPPLSDGCVAGVMRRHIIDKTAVTEKSLSIAALLAADEIFLSNAIKKIRWVGNIGNASYSSKQINEIYSCL